MINIIAEIGINHNGDIEICKKLMMLAKVAGCDFAKLQKRTPNLCVPESQKSLPKETPWGKMTYLQYKERIEFNESQIAELFDFAEKIGIKLFASVWDIPSVDIISKFTKVGKIPSALVTNKELCVYARSKFETLMVSTGMCTEDEVFSLIDIKPDVVFHTNSEYPSKPETLNLNYITYLKKTFQQAKIGYSGHEESIYPTIAAVALGAEVVERHITLDTNMWGSDHKASLTSGDLLRLVKGSIEAAKATKFPSGPRILFEGELSKRKSLRGV